MDMKMNIRDGRCEVLLSGKFTFADNAAFKEVIQQADVAEIRSFVLDFSAVEFIDSAVLGMLMILRSEASRHGQSITLRGAQGQVDKVMRVSQFDTKFTMI